MTNAFTRNENALINMLKINTTDTINKSMPNLSTKWYGDSKRDYIVFAGGMFTSLMHNEEIKDIDIFVLNNHQQIYSNLLSYWSKGTDDIQETTDYTQRLNPHVMKSAKTKADKLNVILTDFKTREELINNFDYKHCCISYAFADNKASLPSLFISKTAFTAAWEKLLIPNNPDTIHEWRTQKFLGRGFKNPSPDIQMATGGGTGDSFIPFKNNSINSNTYGWNEWIKKEYLSSKKDEYTDEMTDSEWRSMIRKLQGL